MNKFFLRLAFAIAVLLPMPSALAADLDVPPPMRPAIWSGHYVGVFGTAVSVDGTWDGDCSTCVAPYSDLEHSGIGYAGGILGGWNY